MQTFKFLQNNKSTRLITRTWFPRVYQGQLQWMTQPVGRIYYIEISMENGFYKEELKSTTIQIYSRYMHSFNEFMEMHRDKVIFAYEFVDNSNLSNMIHYNHETFEDMPKDIPLIFRGLIRSHEVF